MSTVRGSRLPSSSHFPIRTTPSVGSPLGVRRRLLARYDAETRWHANELNASHPLRVLQTKERATMLELAALCTSWWRQMSTGVFPERLTECFTSSGIAPTSTWHVSCPPERATCENQHHDQSSSRACSPNHAHVRSPDVEPRAAHKTSILATGCHWPGKKVYLQRRTPPLARLAPLKQREPLITARTAWMSAWIRPIQALRSAQRPRETQRDPETPFSGSCA